MDNASMRILGNIARSISMVAKKGGSIDDLLNNEKLYKRTVEALGGDEQKAREWIEKKFNGKVKKTNISQEVSMADEAQKNQNNGISLEQIEQIIGKHTSNTHNLLNQFKNELDNLKQQVSGIGEIKQKIENVQPQQVDLSSIVDRINNMESTLQTIPEHTSKEIDGIAKAFLNSLNEIKSELKKEDKPAPKVEQVKSKEVTEDKGNDFVTIDDALKDSNLRKEVFSKIENVAKSDKAVLDELNGLIQRCSLGDKEACEAVEQAAEQAKDNASEDLSKKIDKKLSELDELKKKVEDNIIELKPKENEQVQEKVIKYRNPLKERLFK